MFFDGDCSLNLPLKILNCPRLTGKKPVILNVHKCLSSLTIADTHDPMATAQKQIPVVEKVLMCRAVAFLPLCQLQTSQKCVSQSSIWCVLALSCLYASCSFCGQMGKLQTHWLFQMMMRLSWFQNWDTKASRWQLRRRRHLLRAAPGVFEEINEEPSPVSRLSKPLCCSICRHI